MASFIDLYGGNTQTRRHTGLGSIQKAVSAGLTINEIRSMLTQQGITAGPAGADYLAARPAERFISKFGGNEETFAHTGLGSIQRALATGMTINEVRDQLAREGVQTGEAATKYLADRPADRFISKYGGNVETFAHSGLGSLNRAQAAGMSLAQIREAGQREGITFGERAASVLAQDLQMQNLTDAFTSRIADLDRQRKDEVQAATDAYEKQLQLQKQEDERRSRELKIAEQTQMANVAAGAAQGQFKIGTRRPGVGIDAFKRRLKITPTTAMGITLKNVGTQSGALNI